MKQPIYSTKTVSELLCGTLTNNDETRMHYTKFEFTDEMNMNIINDLLSGEIVSPIHMKIDFVMNNGDKNTNCKQVKTTILNSNEFINSLNNFMKSEEYNQMLTHKEKIKLYSMELPIVSIYEKE